MFADKEAITAFLHGGIKKTKVLVLGDVMLDRYYYGEVKRISPEAPVPITRVTKEQETLGGAANVVHNLALLGGQVYLAGVTGEDENRVRLTKLLSGIGVTAAGLVCSSRPTTTKLRVMGGHQQMLRLDFEDSRPITSRVDQQLRSYIQEVLSAGLACAVISDYGKGVCTAGLCQYLIKNAAKSGIPVIVDPKGINWRKYSEAFLITPNLKELGEAVRKTIVNQDKEVKLAADKLRRRLRLGGLMATRSEKGLSLITEELEVHIPTRAQEVFDVSGAGDTVLAVLAASLAGKIALSDAAQLANLAAGVVVAKLGTYAINLSELVAAVAEAE